MLLHWLEKLVDVFDEWSDDHVIVTFLLILLTSPIWIGVVIAGIIKYCKGRL